MIILLRPHEEKEMELPVTLRVRYSTKSYSVDYSMRQELRVNTYLLVV